MPKLFALRKLLQNSFPNLERIMRSQALSYALDGESEALAKQVHYAAKREAKRLGLPTYTMS